MSEFPILDLEREPPKLRASWAPLAIGAVLGLVLGFVLKGIIELDATWWLPILYLSIAIHEIGHLIAAKLVGMDAGGIAVGGFLLFKSGDHWIFRFDWRRILSGGLAKPLLKDGLLERDAYAWMIAGGPIATILTALAASIAFRLSAQPSSWLVTLAWINVLLLAATAAPTGGVNTSDIPKLWQVLRHPARFRAAAATLQIMTEETAGVRPRDWNTGWFNEMLEADAETGSTSYRQMFAFYRSIDRGDLTAAIPHLEQALAASGTAGRAIQHWCFLEAACSSAKLRNNPVAAEVWLQRARNLRRPESTASIEAAIAQSEGRYQDALDLWTQSLAFLDSKRYDSGLARYARATIDGYQQECRAALAAPAPSFAPDTGAPPDN